MSGPLKRYVVTTPHGVKTTMKLNEADARRMGVLDELGQDAPEKLAEASVQDPAKKRAASNKSRTAANKGGAGGGDD
ncbi:hypothetical protein [Streptomyces sp. V2]|uniref:hypothetical protein n=1 Tax=Streptomyces sp. V2 TaxID=1424099 RepID=UPI0010576A5D|nr:hypothetical protein [Streptomyces sp. V2]